MTQVTEVGLCTIIQGDNLETLRLMPDSSVQCCVTSPPYWGLRDYGQPGQLGLESTPQEYVEKMVAVFREVRRVLRDDGTLWLNLGDSYTSGGRKSRDPGKSKIHPAFEGEAFSDGLRPGNPPGLKEKDLVGIPWRTAFALQQPYYDWQIKTEAMRAWVGGIVDGEGCITIMETKSSHSESLSYPPIVQVRMCDLEPLDRLVQVVGSSYGKPQHPPSQVAANQRPSWQWKVVSEQAANVIAEIYPFLTCKRKQALVAWNHQAFRSARGNGPRQRGEIEKEQFCKTLINQLNQREPVDIPSWMKEPTIAYEPGWYLRQDLIWHKPNPMPESVRDRCTKAHEYIFMLTKSAKYYYDADAIKTPPSPALIKQVEEGYNGESTKDFAASGAQDASGTKQRIIEGARKKLDKQRGHSRRHAGFNDRWDAMTRDEQMSLGANKRDVWTVATKPFKGAHFATFPPDLIEPCILAGSKPGDVVLDPFGGAGTTGLVAQRHNRKSILLELNPDYVSLTAARLQKDLEKQNG